MRTIQVDVTRDDIQRGLPGEHCACPVALAIHRALGLSLLWDRVSVSATFIKISGGREFIGNTPAEVRGWISRFDTGNSVAPFTFEFRFTGR